MLWSLALSIENGDASQALKDLRAAEDKLRDALKKGASPEELKRLTKELRDAAERYLAETMRNGDKQAMQDVDPQDAEDMDAMLDRLQKDAENGAKDDAQAMLDQLQEMTENLRSAENGKADPATKQMRQSMRELGKLLKDQQALARRHLPPGPARALGQRGAGGQTTATASSQERQRALRDRLEEIEKGLRGAGVETPKNLGDASGDMSDAESDLKGQGERSRQGRAGALRPFAEGRRRRIPGQGDRRAAPGRPADGAADARPRQGQEPLRRQGTGRQGENDDPLGRGKDGAQKGSAVGALNGGPDRAERARRVLEELRRRLADPNRPSEERDYLERLIGQP